MDIRKVLVTGGVMVAALGVPATAASASAGVFAPPPGQNFGPPSNVFTATTSLTNRPDSGGQGNWANDAMTRTLTIKETGYTGSGASTVYTYAGTVSDTGTFKTIPGAFTPNQGGTNHNKTITGIVQGSMSGGGSYTFTATSLPTHERNLGVPDHESGPATDGSPQTTSLWFEQAFPASTKFGSPVFDPWSWTYLVGSGNGCTQGNSNGRGNSRGRGNDSGNRGQNNNSSCSCNDGNGRGDGNNRGRGNDFGNRGQNNSCSCSDDNGRGRGNNQGNRGRDNNRNKGCTQDHGNQNRGGKGGNQQGGSPKPSGQKWTDASTNSGGQTADAGNITG
jgi:hypothetical protein